MDIIVFSVILLALGLFIVFGYKLMNTLNTEFQDNPDLSSNSKSLMSDLKGRYVNLFDGIFFTVVILVGIAIAVGVYWLNLHPVFYVPSLFIIIFAIIIAASFGNVFSDVTEASDISAEAAEFTLMPYIMNHFVAFIMALSFIVVIVMYAKYRVTA